MVCQTQTTITVSLMKPGLKLEQVEICSLFMVPIDRLPIKNKEK